MRVTRYAVGALPDKVRQAGRVANLSRCKSITVARNSSNESSRHRDGTRRDQNFIRGQLQVGAVRGRPLLAQRFRGVATDADRCGHLPSLRQPRVQREHPLLRI
jgi:hypothetical protein